MAAYADALPAPPPVGSVPVIDLRLLRDDPETVRASQRARGESESIVDDLLRADGERRVAVQRFEALRAEQKQLGKQMPKASGAGREALLRRTRELSGEVKAAEAAVGEAETALRRAQYAVPNVIEDGAPPGGEDDFVVLREVGTKPEIEHPRDQPMVVPSSRHAERPGTAQTVRRDVSRCWETGSG